jgi:hypothetical protein
VKLQAEVGGDEQILKYNGIGGMQNTTPIPLRTYINSLVEKYKSSIGAIVAEIPDATMVARYDSRYQRTRDMLNDILAKYLHPPQQEEEERDVQDTSTEFQPFDDNPTSSSDNDDDDHPPRRRLKRLRGRSESTASEPDKKRTETVRTSERGLKLYAHQLKDED